MLACRPSKQVNPDDLVLASSTPQDWFFLIFCSRLFREHVLTELGCKSGGLVLLGLIQSFLGTKTSSAASNCRFSFQCSIYIYIYVPQWCNILVVVVPDCVVC